MNLLTETPKTTTPIGTLTYSDAAIFTVAAIVIHRLPQLEYNMASVQEFIDDLAPWQPVTKEGRIAKRIAAYLHKKHKAKLSDKLLAHAGNYLATDLPAEGVTYAITKKFDWKQGEFGDAGSCFFMPSADGIFERLSLSAAYALRFYTKTGKGSGRAFLLPTRQGNTVVVNSYGPSLEQTRNRLRLIAGEVPLNFVELTNFGDRNYHLYINLGAGVLVGETPPPDGRLDLAFEVPRLQQERAAYDTGNCIFCGAMLNLHTIGFDETNDPPHMVRRRVCTHCMLNRRILKCHITGLNYPAEECRQAQMVVQDERSMRRNPLLERWYVRTRLTVNSHLAALNACTWCGAVTRQTERYRCSIHCNESPHTCKACMCDNDIDKLCRRCGRYYNQHETCVCQPKLQERLIPDGNTNTARTAGDTYVPAFTCTSTTTTTAGGYAEFLLSLTAHQEVAANLPAPAPSSAIRERVIEEGNAATLRELRAARDIPPLDGAALPSQVETGEQDAGGPHLPGQGSEDTGGGPPR